MGTDRDGFYLDGWGYDRLQAASTFYSDYGSATARTGRGDDIIMWRETEEALREEIQAQAEVIEAQDMQIEALQEERDALLAELESILPANAPAPHEPQGNSGRTAGNSTQIPTT
jgi:hypothetical protein